MPVKKERDFRDSINLEGREKTDREVISNTADFVDSLAKYLESEKSEEELPNNLETILGAFTSLIRSLESNPAETRNLERLHYLLVSFIDLAVADRMSSYSNIRNFIKSTYAREDKDKGQYHLSQDELYHLLNIGHQTPFQFFEDEWKTGSVHKEISVLSQDVTLDEQFEHIEQLLSDLQDNRADRYYIRKMRVAAHMSETDRENYELAHEEHYQRFFTLEGVPPEAVFLTNSGSRANNAVIETLKRLYPDMKASYVHGWYYENIEGIKDFSVVEPNNAKILFLNAESSNPTDDEVYGTEIHHALYTEISNARNNPDEQFVLVVDATTDLLIGDEFFKYIPDNLTFIKTCSLTKHQRGATNYFFGSVAVWSKDTDLLTTLREEIDESDSNLGHFETIHFPRLRREEIQSNVDKLHSLQTAFDNAFNEGQEVLPPYLRCELYDYNYFTYIRHPFAAAPNLQHVNVFDIKEDQKYFKTADSFGLDETRVCYISTAEGTSIPRISYGLNASETDMAELGRLAADRWKEYVTVNHGGGPAVLYYTNIVEFLSNSKIDREAVLQGLQEYMDIKRAHFQMMARTLLEVTGKPVLNKDAMMAVRDYECLQEIEEMMVEHEKTIDIVLKKIPSQIQIALLDKYSMRNHKVGNSNLSTRERLADFNGDYEEATKGSNIPNPYLDPGEYTIMLESYIGDWQKALQS